MQRVDFEHWRGKEVARLLALVEAERRYYQEMLASLPVALVVLAADRTVVSANRAFRQMFGLRTGELGGKALEQIVRSDRLIEKIRDVTVNSLPDRGFVLAFEEKLLRVSILSLRNLDDEMDTLLMFADVTDVPAPEETVTGAPEAKAPAVAQEPVAAIQSFPTDSLPAVIWRADPSTLVFQEVSGDVESMLGYPKAHWTTATDFFAQRIHPEDRAATLNFYHAALDRSNDASAEFRATTAAGETVWCRETVRVVEPGILCGVCIAITQRKEGEQQRLTAERTSALRGLSARLAHDLNNPLMIITGYAEEMLNGLASGDPRRAEAEQILEATLRIGGVTEQLLEFTRKQAHAPQKINLGALLSGLKNQFARAAGVSVEVIAKAPVWASANGHQLEGVLLALISGVTAEGNRVSITCDAARITEFVETSSDAPLKAGDYARLTVRSNGRGMDATKRLAVFESFLTKDPGTPQKNGAAALAQAYGIVREWGGDIIVNMDSAFVVYLPSVAPEAAPARPIPPPVVVTTPAPIAATSKSEPLRETILVVDDEPGIRALVAKILRRERYLVLEAGSANEAVTVALIHGAPIHLLLTDIMLPDRSGRQVAEQLHEAVRGLKVVYISGFTDDDSVRTGDFPPGSRFLQKPFTLSALVGTVREALDQ